MSVRPSRLLVGLMVATFVATATLGITLSIRNGGDEAVLCVAVVGYVTVGALVARRQPRNAIGWMLMTIGIVLALGALVDANILDADAPAYRLSGWLSAWSWHIWVALAALFVPLLFPDGRPPSARWRPVVWLAVAGTACSIIGAAFAPGALDVDAASEITNPVGVTGVLGRLMDAVSTAGNVLFGVAIVLVAASLVVRFRAARGVRRQQLKWFAFAGLLVAAGLVLALVQLAFGTTGHPTHGSALDLIGSIGWFVALVGVVLAIPGATGLAILRHGLFDVDVVIRRTATYAALSAILATAYLVAVLALQLVFDPLTSDNGLAIAGSTLAVAGLFRPARARIQAFVDRRFYRNRYDAARTVERFGAHVRDQVDLDALAAELRGVTRQTLQPAHVSLWIRDRA